MVLISLKALASSLLVLQLALGTISAVFAQSDPVLPAPKAAASTAPAPLRQEAGPSWSELSADQKVALSPLAASWPSLSSSHKGKWIALVQKYPEMAEADKARLNERMVDWAALSPKDRELARLNFAVSKKIPTDSRLANWEAYQALPESKKQALLDAAPKKAVGAAVAVKPVQANKLAAVPVTRKTPEPVRAVASQRATVDRYTLLPQNPSAKEGIPAPGAK